MYLDKYRKEHPESHAFDELPQFKLSISELEDNTFLNVEHNGEDSDEHKDSQEIQDFIRAQKSANTLKKTRTDLNTFYRFCDSISEQREVHNIPVNELDKILCKFFRDVRKKDGGDYEPGSLTSFQRSIQRHLLEENVPHNIFKDREFSRSREVLSSKRKSLVRQGLGNKPNATREITDEEEEELFRKGLFGDHDPIVLQRTVWWCLAMHFGFRARDESRKLCWGDVELTKDPQTGREMLVWKADRGSKTRHGQESGHKRQFASKVFATETERCPVKFYKSFKAHRPTNANKPNCPFFLAVNSNRRPGDCVWFKCAPLGKNLIGQFMSTAAKVARLVNQGSKKISNHSVRKTSISRLLDANIPENYVMQLSGHKNIQSLSSYKSASLSHQRLMSDTLSNCRSSAISTNPPANSAASLKTTSTTTTSIPSLSSTNISSNTQAVFAGASIGSISNCTIQIMPGPVNIIHKQVVKRRRIAIESDEEDE